MRGQSARPSFPRTRSRRVGATLVLLASLALLGTHTAAAHVTQASVPHGQPAPSAQYGAPSFPGGPVSRLLKAATDVNGTIAPNGSPVTVTLAAGEVARLTFTGSAGQRVFTKFTGITIGSGCFQTVDASILDPGGAPVASKSWLCTSSDYLDAVSLPSDGTYTILLDPVNTNAGSITTTLYDVPADPNPTLTPSVAGDSFTFTTATPGQNAAPTFQGTPGQRIFVKFTNNTISTDCLNTVDTWIVAPGGGNLTQRVDLCQISSSDYIETVPITIGGTYKLVLDPEGSLTGSVTATIYDVPADPTPTVVPTPTGASYTFTTATPGQNASVRFAGTGGQRVFAQFTNNTISTSCLYTVDGWFARPDQTMIGSRVHTCPIPQSDFVDTTTLDAGNGTYSLGLDPQGALSGSVTATLYDVPADVTGTLAIGGAGITKTIATPGQGGQLTFAGTAGQPVKITFTNNSISSSCLSGLRASLVRPGGATIAGPSTMCLPGDSLTATLPVDGTYTIVLDPHGVNKGSVTVAAVLSSAYQPPQQTYGTCGGTGVHALAPSECLADPVNSLTGAYTASTTDLSTAAPGIGFVFRRSYTSADTAAGRLGPGWTDSYATSLAIQPNGDAELRGDDGQRILFGRQADGSYVGAPGSLSTLAQVGAGYKLVRHDQAVYQFDAQGRLTSLVDKNAQGVTLAYDAGGRLATATDAGGRVATFTSNPDGTLAGISLTDGRTVSYGYTGGRLTSVTDPRQKTTTFTYDAGGRLATEVDANNHTVVTNTYDPTSGRVTQQTDAVGKTTTFAWDAATQTATITDPRNDVWKDVYSGNVLLKRIDPLGNATQYGHDTALDRTSVAAPDGATTQLTYDANGNVLTITAPASVGSGKKTMTYNAKNNVTSVTDARGKLTTIGYDAAGINRTSVTQGAATLAQYTYTPSGQVATSTDGNGKTTTYTYDGAGNVASRTDAKGNKTTYTYDANGRVLTRVDPLGNVAGGNPATYTTTYTYDAEGRVLTETDPLGGKTTTTYDAVGNVATVTDPNNHTTTYAYDAANHVTSATGPDPDGGGPLTAPVTTYTYDAAGNLLTTVDPRGNAPGGNPAAFTTARTYDAANRETSVTTPKGGKTTYVYDSDSNLASTVEPRGNVTGANPADYTTAYTYDDAGRMLTTTDALGKVTTYTYDEVGNRTSVTDPNTHKTTYTYDPFGRVLTVTAPDTGVTTYTYDGEGRVLTQTDPNGHVATLTYDAVGNRATLTGPDPDGAGALTPAATTYTYDANNNLKTVTDPNGNATATAGDGTTTYGYDAANRLKTVTYSDTTPSVTFGYDAAGNRTSMVDGSGTVTTVYDGLDRATSVTRGTAAFSYGYDPAGNVTSRTYPDSTNVALAYDADSNIASATVAGATTAYAYDAADHLTQTTLPSGNGYVETRAYDRVGRLVDVKAAKGATVLSEFASTLDPVGNPTTIARTGAVTSTTTYTYDVNDRLASVCFQASCPGSADPFIRWTYDKAGNRLTEARSTGTTTNTYDNADRMTKVGTTNYTYDQNGNQTAAGTRTFAYNVANQLKSTTSGSTTTTYSYDGDGNRLQASTGTTAASKTNYLWDTKSPLPQLALERDGNNALLRRYVYGPTRLSMSTSTATFYYSYDGIGSVSNVTSATGASEWTYAYEPFGSTRTETKNDTKAPANLMKFAGELVDPTALYHLRARQYDAATGRFLSVDPVPGPVGEPVGSSYAYVDDKPTVMVDPSGETLHSYTTGQDMAFLALRPNLPPDGYFAGKVDDPHFSTTAFFRGLHEYVVKGYWIQLSGLPVRAELNLKLQWKTRNGGWLNMGAPRIAIVPPLRKLTAAARCTPGTTRTLRGVLDIDIIGAGDDAKKDYSREKAVRCSR